jgi:hypothetical protein
MGFKTKEEYEKMKENGELVEVPEVSEKGQKVTLTAEELQAIITSSITAAIKAAKEPTPEEAAKLAKEREQEKRRELEKVALAMAEQEKLENQWKGCPHKKERGESALMGQICSDGLIHLVCVKCGWSKPPFAPSQGSTAGGFYLN